MSLATPEVWGSRGHTTFSERTHVILAERPVANGRSITRPLIARVMLAALMFPSAVLIRPKSGFGACTSLTLVLGTVRDFRSVLKASLLGTCVASTVVTGDAFHLMDLLEAFAGGTRMITTEPVASECGLDASSPLTYVSRTPRRADSSSLRTSSLPTFMPATESTLRDAGPLALSTLMLRAVAEAFDLRIHAPLINTFMSTAVLAFIETPPGAVFDRAFVASAQVAAVTPRCAAPVYLALMNAAELARLQERAVAARSPAPVLRAVLRRGLALAGTPLDSARVAVAVVVPVLRTRCVATV